MELPKEEIADRAMAQAVDLQRLFVELVEACVADMHAIAIPLARMEAVTDEGRDMLARVRALGYAGLSGGRWRSLAGLEHQTTDATVIDHMESLIACYGRYCRINTYADLRCAIEALRILNPHFSTDVFLTCLAETAVNQQLDESGIGMVEMRPIHSTIDQQLMRENDMIVGMVRERMWSMLR